MDEKRILHLDCFSGISGDMFVGAMIDLGVEPTYLEQELAKMGLDEYQLTFNRGLRQGISGVKFDVHLNHKDHHHHDHGHKDCAHKHEHHHHKHEHEHEHHHHKHDHKHDHDHAHPHHHDHDHANHHDHGHQHTHGDSHDHHHRNVVDIYNLIDGAGYNEHVTTLAKSMFDVIAVAEAKIHGKTVEEVHFHEVGAVDSIVDVVGAAICIDFLKPDAITTTALAVGSGTVKCAHGIMPVPAPATLEILKGIPIYNNGTKFELVTPTGAAIVKVLATPVEDMPPMIVDAVGYGLGTKDLPNANILRAVMGKKKA